MLSVVDLIEAGTMGPDLAAYALAAIRGGASFLVGALPGGAGKTTIMGALLNLVPADVTLAAADGLAAIERAADGSRRRCYICHEIGRGHYYAYLWDDALRTYFDLPAAGHMLATNLHADTYEQAREQICDDNAVCESALRRMNLMCFLSVNRNGPEVRRQIETVWESDGTTEHRCIWRSEQVNGLVVNSQLADAEELAQARRIIDELLASGRRTIGQVRAFLVDSR